MNFPDRNDRGSGASKSEPMIESLTEQMPQGGESSEGQDGAESVAGRASEHSFLAALPIVHRIVGRHRSRLDSKNGSDLVQEVALRIWQWCTKYQEKSAQMSGGDWNSFAARTAYNEVNRQLSREGRQLRVSLEEAPEIEEPSVEGRTDAEVFSLIQQLWQATCQLSLRQRRSLLLHSQELIIYFLQIGITEKQLAETLDFTVCDTTPSQYWISSVKRFAMGYSSELSVLRMPTNEQWLARSSHSASGVVTRP
jgi:DNA-directed RNA polymerase specialized sigma24 family protein